MDEAGLSLSKCRRRGRNVFGQRATIGTPGQREGNVTMCAAISDNGVIAHSPHTGPYNTQLLMAFLHTLYRDLIQAHERDVVKPDLTNYVTVWNDVSFHRVTTVREWFAAHRRK